MMKGKMINAEHRLIPLVGSLILCALLAGCITEKTGYEPPEPNPSKASETYLKLGVAYMQRGRYDLAESKLQDSIAAKPNADAYNALALLYEHEHDNALVEETYKMLIATFPDYARGYSNYNIFLCKYNRVDQISQLAEKMANLGRDMAAVGQIAAGDCAYSKGKLEEAATSYRQALVFEPYSAGALLPLAEIDLKKGFASEAKEKIDMVHNYIGYSARSVYLAILAYRELGNLIDERKMIQVLRSRYPNTPEARNILGTD